MPERPQILHLFRAAAILCLCAAAAGCAGGDAGEGARNAPMSTVRVAINSDILSTNPGVRRDGNTDMVLYHVVEPLVAPGEDMRPVPMLARSFSRSADGREYRFFLRRGVRFHNGEEMTAKDVVWSWRRLLNPETGFRCLKDFNGEGPTGLAIEAVEAAGKYEVLFRLNRPSTLFLDRMANIQCMAAILHPGSVAQDGSWRAPIGTGPYRLVSRSPGHSVTLARFDGYVSRSDPPNGLAGSKTACIERIVFTVIPDRIAAKSAVYAGDIDLVFAVPLSVAKEVEERAADRGDIRVHHQPTQDWTVLLMQTRDPLLSKPKMRRAIMHAVSREMISRFSTFGYAPPNSSAIPLISRFSDPAVQNHVTYDPALARRLAEEAGYRGEELVIQANHRFSYMYDNAVAIQAMLADAGFNARIEVFDWATQLTNFLDGDFQLSSFGYSARAHPALVFSNIIGDKDERPSAQWENEAAFELLRQAQRADGDAEMQAALNRLDRLMQQQVPLVGLYNDHVIDIASSGLAGYSTWMFGRPRLWNVCWKDQRGGCGQ